jgi:hypothetical protein
MGEFGERHELIDARKAIPRLHPHVLRFPDLPQAAAMAAERQPVKWTNATPEARSWTTQLAQRLKWPSDRLQW